MEFRADIDQFGFEKFAEPMFAQQELRVSETYASLGCKLRRFKSAAELAKHAHGIAADERDLLLVSLWQDGSGPAPLVTRTPLALAEGEEGSFRDQLKGWGLIQLQFSRQPAFRKLFGSCRLSVNSQRRAKTWHATYPELGPPEAWNWKAIEAFARRLGRALQRLDPKTVA